MSANTQNLPSIFTYNRPKVIPSKEKPLPAIFSYKQPEQEALDLEEKRPEPKLSFTQRVAQDITESEELEKDIERQRARGTSRIIERTAGLPGDIVKLAQDITGKKAAEFPLPTSAQLQEKSERLSQGYTKAQTPFEEKTDELIGDISSFMLPSGSSYGIARNLGIPVVANLAKEGIQYSGADEKNAGYGKIGTMIALDLIGRRAKTGGIQKHIGNLFRDAEAAIPQGALADASNLERALTALESGLQQGGTASSKTTSLQKIGQIRGKIQNGQIDPKELVEFRKTINEALEEAGGFKLETPKSVQRRTISNLNKVKREVIRAGEDYGTTQNPEFLHNWRSANEASAAFQQSNVISNFIRKNFGDKFKSTSAKALFGLGGPGTIAAVSGLKGLATTTGIGTALGAGYQGYKILSRVINSPTLRRYYGNTLKAASENNAVQMVQNLNLLDKKLADEEKREKNKVEELLKD